MSNLVKALWTIVVAVLLATGAYLVESKVSNTRLEADLATTKIRVESISVRVKSINDMITELQLSKAATDVVLDNFRKETENLAIITNRLHDTVLILEERSKSR